LEKLLPPSSQDDNSSLLTFYRQELNFLREKIGSNLSNYSAWHYRTKYLEKLFQQCSITEKANILEEEFKTMLNAVYTDCSDQAAWFYFKWLLKWSTESDNEKYLEEIEKLNNLEEENNKWSMLTLVQLWTKIDKFKYKQQIENNLVKLARIDPDRSEFYLDRLKQHTKEKEEIHS